MIDKFSNIRIMLENLPAELQWNVLKFLRHPIAEIFLNEPSVNQFIQTREDTYTDIGGVEYQINDLIPYYDIWRIYKFNNKKYRCVYRIVKMKIE